MKRFERYLRGLDEEQLHTVWHALIVLHADMPLASEISEEIGRAIATVEASLEAS